MRVVGVLVVSSQVLVDASTTPHNNKPPRFPWFARLAASLPFRSRYSESETLTAALKQCMKWKSWHNWGKRESLHLQQSLESQFETSDVAALTNEQKIHYLDSVSKLILIWDNNFPAACQRVLTNSLAQNERDELCEIRADTQEEYSLGKFLVNTGDGMVYLARPKTNDESRKTTGESSFPYIIKYQLKQSNSPSEKKHDDDDSLHPLVTEFKIASFAASFGHKSSFTPKPIYLSPEYLAPKGITEKCRHLFCDYNGDYYVRFVIMERVGPSLAALSAPRAEDGSRLDPLFLMKAMMSALDALAYLHSLGIVHNDIHPGNICLADYSMNVTDDFDYTTYDLTGQIRLIDFGVSRVLNDEGSVLLQGKLSGAGKATPALLSYNVLKGNEPAYRDDLVRLVESIASLWRGKWFPSLGTTEELVDMKAKAEFFQKLNDEPDPLHKIANSKSRNSIRRVMNLAASFVTHNTNHISWSYRVLRMSIQFVITCIKTNVCPDIHAERKVDKMPVAGLRSTITS